MAQTLKVRFSIYREEKGRNVQGTFLAVVGNVDQSSGDLIRTRILNGGGEATFKRTRSGYQLVTLMLDLREKFAIKGHLERFLGSDFLEVPVDEALTVRTALKEERVIKIGEWEITPSRLKRLRPNWSEVVERSEK